MRRTARARRCPRARSRRSGRPRACRSASRSAPRIDRRRELAQEEADRDRERRGEQHRAERRDDRADDQVARAELVQRRRSSRCATGTTRWKTLIAGQAPSATRQTIARTTRRRSAAASRGQAVQQRGRRSGRPASRVRGERAVGVAGGSPRAPAFQLTIACRATCHHSVTRRSHPVYPWRGACRDSRDDSPWIDLRRSAPRSSRATAAAARTSARRRLRHPDLSRPLRQVRRRQGRHASTSTANAITALIGPSGCGKSTVLRCLNRMNDLVPSAKVDGQRPLPRRRSLRRGRRPDRGAAPDRNGLPAPEPVPEVDLRQRRLRPADPRA